MLHQEAPVTMRRCAKCSEMAVWDYMPSDMDGSYYCDAHVPRGCSCNWDSETQTEILDDDGRQLPCCEYDYNVGGFNDAD